MYFTYCSGAAWRDAGESKDRKAFASVLEMVRQVMIDITSVMRCYVMSSYLQRRPTTNRLKPFLTTHTQGERTWTRGVLHAGHVDEGPSDAAEGSRTDGLQPQLGHF